MKKLILMRVQILIILLFAVSFAYAQKDSACKVLLKEISGTYKGSCKNGFAEGKGYAVGEDTYSGYFVRGLPDGKGTYTFKNGNIFSGNWKNGLKNGKGEFKYSINGKSSIVSGYWKNGDYVGTSKPEDDYRINSLSGIEYYTIKKIADTTNIVQLSFEKFMKKYIPADLTVTISSGYKITQGYKIVIQNCTYPFTCEMHFTIQYSPDIVRECNLTFTVYKKGGWDVFISNS